MIKKLVRWEVVGKPRDQLSCVDTSKSYFQRWSDDRITFFIDDSLVQGYVDISGIDVFCSLQCDHFYILFPSLDDNLSLFSALEFINPVLKFSIQVPHEWIDKIVQNCLIEIDRRGQRGENSSGWTSSRNLKPLLRLYSIQGNLKSSWTVIPNDVFCVRK
jgi:hypothetical protein